MNQKDYAKRNLIYFPLGTIGRDMIYNLVTYFLLTYVLFTKGLTSAQLGALTVIMAVTRVFDALNDPVMGNIIEHTRTRFGKFKPWLAAGILTTFAVVYLMFNSKLTGWSYIILFGVLYFLYSITYTMHDISYWGMVSALSSETDMRNRLTARATLFAGIGGTLAAVLIPFFTTGSHTIGGNTSTAYGTVALIVCILAVFFLAFTIFGVHEHRDEAKAAPPISFKKIIGTITGNDQLLWIALIFLIQQIGNGLVMGGIGSTYIYFEFGYEGGLVSIFQTVGMAATAILMIFYPAISRRLHRKPLMGKLLLISLAGYALTLLTGLFMPTNTIKYWCIVIGYMLANFGQYGFYLIMMISIINTVEYNEYKNGTRDEAIITSLRPFLTKMSSALIVILTTLSYAVLGVTATMNKISEYEQAAETGAITEAEKLSGIGQLLAGSTGSQTVGLALIMSILPCVLMVISFFLYRKYYRLDEEEYERICAELGKEQ